MAELTYKPGLADFLKDKILLLDTCVLIELMRCSELVTTFLKWLSNGSIPMIMADVYNEFIFKVKSVHELERCKKLINELQVVIFQGADKFCLMPVGEKFQMISNIIRDDESRQRRAIIKNGAPEYKPSIIDTRLLFLSTFQFGAKSIALLTSNHSDVPHCLFDNHGVITVTDDAGIRSVGIYTANKDNLTKALTKIK